MSKVSLLLSGVLLLGLGAVAARLVEPVGRYQLISGKHRVLTTDKVESVDGVFRMDTRTGELWEFFQERNPQKDSFKTVWLRYDPESGFAQ